MTHNPVQESPAQEKPTPEMPDLSRAVNLHDIAEWGRARLSANAHGYYTSGAGDEHTLRANAEGFRALKLRPRMLRDVSQVSTETTLLGQAVSSPIAVSPAAFQGLAHPDAELGTARAVHAALGIMTLSTFSNSTIEDVAQAAAGRLWFQLYLYTDKAVSQGLVQRAEAAGARALVLTVDTPRLGRREINERQRFALPPHLEVPNAGSREAMAGMESSDGSQLVRYFQGLVDPAISWKDVEWLRGITGLPIVLKGILTAEDATLAVQHGCHVWASNHGGRQLDTAITALDALPEIVQAVQGQAEVYMDGGVMRGVDVLKAVALGARGVFIGRPVLYGLACGGQAGVARVLELLHAELRLAMELSGCRSLDEVTDALIWRGR
jgi:4-hydroxymandelate oxidase